MGKKSDIIKQILNSVNDEQRKVVTSTKGVYLVNAGAGSGKTFTLIQRCAYILAKGLAKPNEILLLTFTNKAANEMKERIARILNIKAPSRLKAMTFHSFCVLLIRRYGDIVGIERDFTILDENDALSLYKMVYDSFDNIPNSIKKNFPYSYLYNLRSLAIEKMQSQKEVLLDFVGDNTFIYDEYVYNEAIFNLIDRTYEEVKRETNTLDFDDMLKYGLKILTSEYQDIISGQYKYIMVDEAQDVTKIQIMISLYLASIHENIMFVGDDAQSIYFFRGSDIRNLTEFENLLPFKAKVSRLTLNYNYRSYPRILKLAEEVIRPSTFCRFKPLVPVKKDKDNSNLPILAIFGSNIDQANYVADIISRTINEKPNEDIAVLFRKGFQSYYLEVELKKRNISFVKYGGFSIFDRAHIKDFLSMLRILINKKDKMAWLRVLVLFKGIGVKTASKLASLIAENGYKVLNSSGIIPNKSKPQIQELYSVIRKARRMVIKKKPVYDIVKNVFEYYLSIMKEKYDNEEQREFELKFILDISKGVKTLHKFVNELTLDTSNINNKDTKAQVVLSTVHSAKGLEWDNVIIIDVDNKSFPSNRSTSLYEIDEERRLLFVAITRAKKNLWLCNVDESSNLDLLDAGLSIKSANTDSGDLETLSPFLKQLDDYFSIHNFKRTGYLCKY